MGVYKTMLNGVRIDKGVLAPGWTSYKDRIQYATIDVTDQLEKKNILSVGVGQGWAVGYIGHVDTNHWFADHTSLIAWLDVLYTDGTKSSIATDESWDVYNNEVTFTEIYHGETVDKTLPIKKLGKAVKSVVKTKLIPQVGEHITEQERLAPVEYIVTPKGERVIDFGQNMTGYVELKIKAPRGTRVVLHARRAAPRRGAG